MTTLDAAPSLAEDVSVAAEPRIGRHGAQRTFQLALATVWLVDAVLQIQPFMFTRGRNGFSGMLSDMAAGNPGFLGHAIAWNGSVVDHRPVLTNTLFALIQFTVALGIAHRRTVKPALALSIAWALAVWWFGEGFGGIFSGAATPLGGGPGGVLFYALLAVVLWPSDRTDVPFVAAKSMGVGRARAVWAAVWSVLAVLCVVGAGRQGQALHDLVDGMTGGQPGWLVHIDRVSEAFLLHRGTLVAVLLAVVCVLTAASVFVSPEMTRVMIVVTSVSFAVIWVAVQDLGNILAGGATDPNSGPLVVLFALSYWPLESWVTTRAGRRWGAPAATDGTI